MMKLDPSIFKTINPATGEVIESSELLIAFR